VARALAEHGPATAACLAESLGTSATAVRRPLRALTDAGLVQARERSPYGPGPQRGRGRPSAVFTLTNEGRAACDQGYDTLALETLRFLAERDGREAVADFAAQRARRIVQGAEAAGTLNVEQVARRFTEQGFAATVEPLTSGGEQLCQHHCPVVEAAGEFPELCEAETEAMSVALGTHVTRLATLAHGDGICTTLVPDMQER